MASSADAYIRREYIQINVLIESLKQLIAFQFQQRIKIQAQIDMPSKFCMNQFAKRYMF